MSAIHSLIEDCGLVAKSLCFLQLFRQRTFFIGLPSVIFVNFYVCHEYDAALSDCV